jgi:hypothetical protein
MAISVLTRPEFPSKSFSNPTSHYVRDFPSYAYVINTPYLKSSVILVESISFIDDSIEGEIIVNM